MLEMQVHTTSGQGDGPVMVLRVAPSGADPLCMHACIHFMSGALQLALHLARARHGPGELFMLFKPIYSPGQRNWNGCSIENRASYTC